MEFTALFIWLSLCFVLGGLIHYVLGGSMSHRLVQVLAMPGLVIRKFAMTLVALACGGTVTKVCIYDAGARDIDFRADGASSVAKVVVPLAPLFGCAVAMIALNSLLGHPIRLNYAPPPLDSLDAVGLRGFFHGTWALLSAVVRQGIQVDWHTPRLYVLFALTFSLALGACAPIDRLREAALGSALVAVMLGLLSSISIRRGAQNPMPAGWFLATKGFVVTCSAAAFVMMVYGVLATLVVGLSVRIYELVAGRGGKTLSLPGGRKTRKRAA